ncbi:MAG: helix-turn-helix domain-containing protein [Campylobacterales bacterium]|nr:helix-turn-helix domain-containing protein [Campylobacterales bacterium]
MNDIEIAEKHKMIGRNVAIFRKRKGLSQLELSLSLGHKSVSIVASAERFYKGKHFNIEHLLKISDILGVPISVFFEPEIGSEN